MARFLVAVAGAALLLQGCTQHPGKMEEAARPADPPAATTFETGPESQASAPAPPAREGPIEHRAMRPVFPPPDPEIAPDPSPEAAEGKRQAAGLSSAFERAARRAVPAVVTIHRVSPASVSPDAADGRSEELRRFFGVPPRRSGPRQSLASGVVIDSSGLVLTNQHVVQGKADITVQLQDGREFKAQNIKTDARTDLAILRIDGAGPLPTAVFGDSDQLQIGDWVLAVGNPFGLDATVTAGIISAMGRGVGSGPRDDFLQTDAAINPGNSGGPLVNIRGEVVGINAAIETTTGGYQGVGFAIPINLAKWVTEQLVDHGYVRRAYLGVSVQQITPRLARKLKTTPAQGLLVSDVRSDSPAGQAGVRPGDVITRFAGQPMPRTGRLGATIERLPIGSRQSLDVVRDGEPLRIEVTLREEPRGYFRPQANQGLAEAASAQ